MRRLVFTEKRDRDGRSLLCHVAATDLARAFGMSRPAITYSALRGKEVVRQKGHTLGRNL